MLYEIKIPQIVIDNILSSQYLHWLLLQKHLLFLDYEKNSKFFLLCLFCRLRQELSQDKWIKKSIIVSMNIFFVVCTIAFNTRSSFFSPRKKCDSQIQTKNSMKKYKNWLKNENQYY